MIDPKTEIHVLLNIIASSDDVVLIEIAKKRIKEITVQLKLEEIGADFECQ